MRFGPYILETRMAVGGTAEVYLARPVDARVEPKRLVVKRLLPDFLADPDGRTMFEREARLHSSVHHENVVTVFGSGTSEDGEPYLAMEWVEGIDLFRLLRRLRLDRRPLPLSLAAYVAMQVALGLQAVHSAKDDAGHPLEIVHRDVTPSNIYLGRDGTVKLGDFGIARDDSVVTARTGSAVLKGKYAYLSPEQVAGEPFDKRADLFALATVLAEMLLGEQLWPGAGQLAVLLAIRDCRLDSLHAIRDRLPASLYDLLVVALAREPEDRVTSAADVAAALAPLVPATAAAELATLVQWGMSSRSDVGLQAVRESEKLRASLPVEPDFEALPQERPTGEYSTLPSFVTTMRGKQHGPWTFASLVEAVATGTVGRGDQVDYMGRGFASIETIEELVRFLPAATPATSDVLGPGNPDWAYDLSQTAMLEVMLTLLERGNDGVLIAQTEERGGRKELYVLKGRLHHVASTNATELLGEYLVRRGKVSREELDMALAVLPRNHGRMGDTLISLGLVSPVDIFQAIREQGRDRVADVFMWKNGRASFYGGQAAAHVEFPLDLDLPSLLLSGMEAALPGETELERYRGRLHDVLGPGTRERPALAALKWPPQISAIEALARRPRRLSEVLSDATRGGQTTAGMVLRVIDILLAAKLLALQTR